jgi:hypothetical protein
MPYLKASQVSGVRLCTPKMHAVCACHVICMPYMHALYARLICMPDLHALYAWHAFHVYLIYLHLCVPYMHALYVCARATQTRAGS